MARFKVVPLENSPDYLVLRTAMRMKTALYRTLFGSGLRVSPEQWSILNRLWEKEGVSQSELAEQTSRDRHNMHRILGLMEKNGLIRREEDPLDSRRSNIFLTARGREIKAELVPLVEDFGDTVFAGLSDEEVRQLWRLHERIGANLEKLEKAQGGG